MKDMSQTKLLDIKEDFKPHEFDPRLDEDLLFFHVYDKKSQSPFRPSWGILPGAIPVRKAYRLRITPQSISEHLDAFNRVPTPFISLYDDQADAWAEGQRRLADPEVWNPLTSRWEQRGTVEIAILSAAAMTEAGIFYFSAQELAGSEMLDLRPMNKLRRALKGSEWFAMDWIPCSAMEGFLDLYMDLERERCSCSP
jgi:hypothetical protein